MIHAHAITFDADDAAALARFWSDALGQPLDEGASREFASIGMSTPEPPPSGRWMFIRVPEGKTAKNRVHLDLQPSGLSRDAAVDRAVELGATIIGDFRTPDGRGWVTLADPEGNEFCLEPSTEERAAVAGPRHFTIGVASS